MVYNGSVRCWSSQMIVECIGGLSVCIADVLSCSICNSVFTLLGDSHVFTVK